MRCAIYARVSKERCPRCSHLFSEHVLACKHPNCSCPEYSGQDPENQLEELRRYAAAQNWQIVEYVDRAKGWVPDREFLKQVFRDASQRKFDVVLVWALDRLTREGIWETFDYIRKLSQFRVSFESYTEAHFRTSGPAGDLMIAIAAWIAKQERARISDRTKAALARARAKGRVGGRPAKVFDRSRARELRDSGMSWRCIASELGVAASSIRDFIKPRVRKPSSGVRKTSPENG